MRLLWSFFAESEMTSVLETEARELLVLAFPTHTDFFRTTSYRGSVPEYRLFGRGADGKLIAHIECGRRLASANGHSVHILGIGSVAVHPSAQRGGVGREMFGQLRRHATEQRLADFGLLECREAVAGFYQRAGLNRVQQPCTSIHHETGESETYHGPVMVMPLLRPMEEWPQGGVVNLKGMSW